MVLKIAWFVFTAAYGPYCQYHLSWSRNKENLRNGVMQAKVWTPEKLAEVSVSHSPAYSDSRSNSSQFEWTNLNQRRKGLTAESAFRLTTFAGVSSQVNSWIQGRTLSSVSWSQIIFCKNVNGTETYSW